MRIIRAMGIGILLWGIVLKVIGFPGYTLAFIVGAALILSARIYHLSDATGENS